MRIGVVSDSHVGEALPELPGWVLDRLDGVDLILHAGDLTEMSVVRTLEQVAPTLAVLGDHDRDAGLDLPEARVVRAGRHRIGLVHGRRSRLVEYPAAGVTLLAGRPRLLGFHRALLRRLPGVDCVVYGHLHLPFIGRLDGVDLFSPGAVYVPEAEPGYYSDRARGRAYLRFRRTLRDDARRPSVGVVEAGGDRLRYRLLPAG